METTPPDEGESLRSLDAQLGQLSATWDPIAAPPAQSTTRRGKWTAPECDYAAVVIEHFANCLLYTSPSPRDATLSRMPSSA